MNTQSKIYLAIVIALAVIVSGCGTSTDTPSNGSNTNVSNATANGSNNAANPLEPTKKPDVTTTNNAPTLGPVVNAYYDALRKKDAAAVRKVMAADFLESTEKNMKEEKKTDLVGYLTEFDKLPDGQMEVRNEQITGNRGTAIVKGGAYVGQGTTMVFKNEGGVWKVSNEVPR